MRNKPNMHPKSLTQIAELKQVGKCQLNLIYNGMYCLGLQWNDEVGAHYVVLASQSLIRLFLQKKVNLLDVISAPDSTYFALENENYEVIKIGQQQEVIPGLVASSVQLSNIKSDGMEGLLHFFDGNLRLRLIDELKNEYQAFPGKSIVREPYEPIHEFKKEEVLKMLVLSEELQKLNNILRVGYTRVDFTVEDLVCEVLETIQPTFETYGDLFVFIIDMIRQMLSPQEGVFLPAVEDAGDTWKLPFSAN